MSHYEISLQLQLQENNYEIFHDCNLYLTLKFLSQRNNVVIVRYEVVILKK